MFKAIEEEQVVRILIKGPVGDLKQEMIKRYSARQIPTPDEVADHILKLTTMYQEFDQPDKYYVPSSSQVVPTDRKKDDIKMRITDASQIPNQETSVNTTDKKKENDKTEAKLCKPRRTIPLDANGNPTTLCPSCGQPGHWKADWPIKEKQGFRSPRPN
jgi:hypothetical protein